MHKKPAAKPVVATRTVKIGLLAPLTGDLANYGQVLERGAQLAHRDFNQEGLTIKLYPRDTGCDATKAVDATKEFVKLGVVAIIGDTCSSSTAAALPIANENKILILSPSASSASLSIANDFFFRTYPTDSHQGVFATKLMYDRGLHKIAIMHGTDTYGTSLDATAKTEFAKLGGTITSDTSFESTDTDFKATLRTILADKPDALYIISKDEAASAAIVVEARQLGLTVPVYGSDALKDTSFITDMGAVGNGMTVIAPTTGNQTFLDEYKATYGAEPANATGAQSYDAYMALMRAIKNGATTGDAIRKALPTTDFQGVSGEIKFDSNGDLAGGGYNIFTIKDGAFVLTKK